MPFKGHQCPAMAEAPKLVDITQLATDQLQGGKIGITLDATYYLPLDVQLSFPRKVNTISVRIATWRGLMIQLAAGKHIHRQEYEGA
ncbi:hypothetical protein L2E82_26857 [Cichorium intybus]|uniref:Uncharacterized protein n=1 Tax=Cichorium intybus TaxID=13427 RepID=A0ACB9CRH7_CICIN|nr:hypothetical protein L2E82_26857 [Cichorium intybus]